MPEWKGTTIQITIALIGASSVFAAGIGGYFSELNKPDVKIGITGNNEESIINMTNMGKKPATNLVLTVDSEKNITTGSMFTSENVSRPDLKSKPIQVSIPRLVQGDGSVVSLNLTDVPRGEIGKVYATYDQGSTFYKEYTSIDGLYDAIVTSLSYIGWVILIVVGAGGILFIILNLRLRRNVAEIRRRYEVEREIDFFRELLWFLFEIHDSLLRNPTSLEQLGGKEKFWFSAPSPKGKSIQYYKLRVISDNQEFKIVSNFFIDLDKRNLRVLNLTKDKKDDATQNETIENEVRTLNQRCVDMAEKVLIEVDWRKHAVKTQIKAQLF